MQWYAKFEKAFMHIDVLLAYIRICINAERAALWMKNDVTTLTFLFQIINHRHVCTRDDSYPFSEYSYICQSCSYLDMVARITIRRLFNFLQWFLRKFCLVPKLYGQPSYIVKQNITYKNITRQNVHIDVGTNIRQIYKQSKMSVRIYRHKI